MRKTSRYGNVPRLTITSAELMEALGCGRPAAEEIGKAAHAKINVGRRVLWNVSKIQRYLDKVSEGDSDE